MKPSVFRERMAGASIAYRDCADLCNEIANAPEALDKTSEHFTQRELAVSAQAIRAAFSHLATMLRNKADNAQRVAMFTGERPH